MAEVTRVTQGGIQVLRSGNPKYRVTQGGIQVLMASPYPSQPILITPYDGFKAAETLVIQYTESVDPLGGGVTYYCRYKEDIDTVWTWIFQNRSGNDTYYHDISGDSDGDYEIELWAESASYSSGKATADFVIHNGMPTAPVITDPYEGQQWQKTTNRVEWEAATDPDEDPLTYEARYKKVSASSWTDLFDSVSNLYYDWNQTGFDVDDYELEVWANDGVGDGPADHVYFSIFIADEPIVPRIRIVEIGIDYVIAELEEYDHPQARAWQATKWELIPFGGDWSNPVVSYTTTDSSEQLQYTFTGLSPGFRGSVRATFQDNANTWGDPSTEAYFEIPGTTTDWERRWERNASWIVSGLGIQARAGDWGAGYNPQPISAIVNPEAENIGSFRLEGYVMAGGCYCGWPGRDTELRRIGIGVFKGDSERGGEYAIFFGIEFGTVTSGLTGAHTAYPYLYANFEECQTYSAKSVYGDEFVAYSQVTAGVQAQFGQPVGDWRSPWTHYPIYWLELEVQRNVATNTAVAKGRITYVGFGGSKFPTEDLVDKSVARDEWDIEFEFPCLTTCAKPGFYQGQHAHGWDSAYGEYYGLRYVALRDAGQEYVVNVDPLTPYEEPGPGPCSVVTEDALPDPVFFPAPPNGDVEEDWIHPSDLITARNDTEQRISLRDIPVERIKFETRLPTSREVAQLQSLIWEEQPSRWGVPLWMDAARLDQDLSSGATSIPAASVDIDGRRFDEATYVALWKDQFTWDFLPATLEPDGSISLTGSTSRTYYAYETYVIPCRIGRMRKTAEFTRASPEIGDLPVTFILEAVDG